ncbi:MULTISPECIES: general stress protein [unclassified Sutcliffiella]|uniref:general stress protein n=1 Tax=unclassified Sutcliffiella TaxID=2837532 RepID=UPI0030CADCA0
MTEQRMEIVGSYLMEEEAMNKVNWLKNEGYHPEEIWIIRDRRGVLEQLGEEPISGVSSSEETNYANTSATSSVVSPGSLLKPESKSVAATLMELGIDKEEAYRYEFDVKVGKMLILATPVPTSEVGTAESHVDNYSVSEEPAMMIDEDDKQGGAMKSTSEHHIKIDGPENVAGTSSHTSGNAPGSSINRPMPDANIDGTVPLDEQLLREEPVVDEKVEKDFAREEVISLHDQASVTNESPTMEREEMRADTLSRESNNGKRYAENKTEEDVDKALLYEHGQPFPMEKPYEEEVYDKNVIADGPLHVEDVPGDATTTEREKPLFQSDEGVRPKSALEQEEEMSNEDNGPILFEDTLNEMERDKPGVGMEPGLDEEGTLVTESQEDLYTTEYEEGELVDEEADIYPEAPSNYENETSVFEEDTPEPFSSRKKERMETRRAELFDTEDDDLFRK